MAQSVKHLTLDLSSGLGLSVVEFKHHIELHTVHEAYLKQTNKQKTNQPTKQKNVFTLCKQHISHVYHSPPFLKFPAIPLCSTLSHPQPLIATDQFYVFLPEGHINGIIHYIAFLTLAPFT